MKVLAVMAVLALAGGGVARADAVNLLGAVPVQIAVSSTVENPAIVPAHLVDGKLDTAWNSHTGELVGAWIAVNLPDDAKVEKIAMTVGFTKVDPKWGDLFVMNPRIKKVRITNAAQHRLVDKELDPKLRTLQDIAIPGGGGGGTWRIEVLEIVPGTRKDWQEINVSELEVWGTAPKVAPGTKPTVHVGHFDHDDLTRVQCMAALGVSGKIASYATEDFTGDLSVCRVDVTTEHTVDGDIAHDKGTVAIGIVKRGAKPVRVAKLPAFATEASTTKNGPPMGYDDTATTIAYRIVPLTTTESALEVTTHVDARNISHDDDDATVALYRVAGGAATKILEFGYKAGGSTNGGNSMLCKLDDPAPGAKLPAQLDVTCTDHHERYGGNGPEDQNSDTETTDHYKWTGKAYSAP